jgi:hypothetical protein
VTPFSTLTHNESSIREEKETGRKTAQRGTGWKLSKLAEKY